MRKYPKHEENPEINKRWIDIFREYKNNPFLEATFSKIYRHGYCLFHKEEDVIDRVSSILNSHEIPFTKYDEDKIYWKLNLNY
ncbi:hypothetical protein [Virgibacillus sp. DJP39]|uniref:hypothetical protein n=1 Tax=Virgibacillus sp. DJP39 TaxID=3409790 RepID=UPI003BB7058A